MSSVLKFSNLSILSSSKSSKSATSILFSDTHFSENPPNPVQASYRPFKIRLSHSTKNREKPKPQNTNFSLLSEDTHLSTNSAVKAPTPPWMQGPLILPCSEVLDLSRGRPKKGKSRGEDSERRNASLTEKVSGGRGRQAMRRIVESITKLQESRDFEETREELGEFELRVPLELIGEDENSKCEVRMPWMSHEKVVFRRMKKERVATAAELSLDEMVVKRLRNEARKMRTWVKGKKAGVTQVVVDEIKRTWRQNELAMVKFCFPLCRNMDRAREILELKTGGLVVWSNKDTHVVYRGSSYNSSLKPYQKKHSENAHVVDTSSLHVNVVKPEVRKTALSGIQQDEVTQAGNSSIHEFIGENLELQSVSGTLYEREADRLLNGLGPRFVDWWWPKPLPVDADLLPEVIPGFMTPYRCCPPRVELN
ncbi:hypothetical protein Syun_022222 [Stephania yunnanensis]|uniref:CRM domain-containing protein n=1 Tax=Stephania yunnanensis TaxID=152371 RepID=A0AAP0IHU7_9MAGN